MGSEQADGTCQTRCGRDDNWARRSSEISKQNLPSSGNGIKL